MLYYPIVVSLAFNLLDVISGIVKGLKAGNKLDSAKLRNGLFKKSGFILCYCLGVIITLGQGWLELPFSINIMPAICGYVILTEVVSIIENIAEINPNILPDKLKAIIGITKKDDE